MCIRDRKYTERLKVKAPSLDALVSSLSGGNQQKIVVAKWLLRDTDVLIFDEPTRGIDIGAKDEICELLISLADMGKAVIMISSEMQEILRVCDRILVLSLIHIWTIGRNLWSQSLNLCLSMGGAKL